MAFEIDAKGEVGTEIVRAIRDQLAEGIQQSVTHAEIQERIHVVRTSCKKGRAGLKLMRGVDLKLYRRENAALREAANALSALRDVQIAPQSFGSVVKACATAAQRKQLAPLRRRLHQRERQAASAHAEINRQIKNSADRMGKTATHLAEESPKATVNDVIAELGRTYKRARRALESARARPGGVAFHEWRKATKKFLYQIRLLREIWPPGMRALYKLLKKLGGDLGDEHDLTILDQMMSELKQAGVDQVIIRRARSLVKIRQHELRKDALAFGARLFSDKPAVVKQRMKDWWQFARSAT